MQVTAALFGYSVCLVALIQIGNCRSHHHHNHKHIRNVCNGRRRGTTGNHEGECPPSSHGKSTQEECSACSCWADSQCGHNKKCCHNGCTYTCMQVITPPLVFDWLEEPTRQRESGKAWLIDGPEDNLAEEVCTTSIFPDDDSLPLECPTGYQCFIQDDGDIEQGIPNRGVCVKQ
ncbi:WAP four-disulfide core domain protein 1-like isoform X2 [Anneissia japonica]|uniref:WAP four-disulfide core domain protein 1-like isoform X2 n=1 Tax=Anneissia japonica TaxID=1529436 RepID=UPI0014254CE3|nr:WAP four-disulfide core domain protein 1-like isoform X2 [Anneissia japonica]